MVEIDENILRLIIQEGNVVLVASVSPSGIPNIAPRYVLDVIKNEKLVFADAYENKTYHNIGAWPKVAVAVFDMDAEGGGYQLKGDVEEITDSGMVSFAARRLKEFGIDAAPRRVWALAVKEIFSLQPSAKSRYPIASAYG